jgi:hypothetical protein
MPKTEDLVKVNMDMSIQEFFRAYKYSKTRSSGVNKKKYPRPFLSNVVSLYLTRKYIWGELPKETKFFWEIYNPSRTTTKGVKFDAELIRQGVPLKYLYNDVTEYTPNSLRNDSVLNRHLDTFKSIILQSLDKPLTYREQQHFITTNFSLRIPDPESKLLVDGQLIGVSYFDIPFYVLNGNVAKTYIEISEPIIMDHMFSKKREAEAPSEILHEVQSELLQIALDVGHSQFLIGDPTF